MAPNVSSPSSASLVARIRARAPTYLQYTLEQPSWIAMFAFARFPAGRRLERWLRRATYRKAGPAPDSIFGKLDLDGMLQKIIDDGVCLGLKLPDNLIREIGHFANSHECYSRDRSDFGFLPRDVRKANRERERDVLAAHYFETVEQCPAIRQLANDPALLNLGTAYLGHDAILVRTRLWWSFPAIRFADEDLHAAAQEKFHYDMNGWRTLKFFFYLTPTDERSGAHRCIIGSHRNRSLRQQLALMLGQPTDELEAFYGKDRFLTITGDAGTGFAEDPFVFHTGSLCLGNPRLILELEYSDRNLSPSYRYGRKG